MRAISVFLLALLLLPRPTGVGAAEQLVIELNPPKAPRGTIITINGRNALPNTQVRIIYGYFGDLNSCLGYQLGQGDTAGVVTADAQGRFTLQHQPYTGFAADKNYTVRYSATGEGRDPSAWVCFEIGEAGRTFPETGKTVQGRFLAYWQAHGGLAINGYPLSDEITETIDGQPYTVQYFERVRMEYHPENVGTPYEVLLGQFGRQLHPADPPVAALPGAAFFAETGHNVTRQAFADYWQANGGLPQFGYPISEEIEETLPGPDGQPHSYRVQYFERARIEWHPENSDPQFQVLLGQFGRTVCADRCR